MSEPAQFVSDAIAAARQRAAGHTLLVRLGARLVQFEPGRAEVELEASTGTAAPDAVVDAEVVAGLARAAATLACHSMLPNDRRTCPLDVRVDFTGPARGSKLVGRGKLLRLGRSLAVVRATVEAVDEAGGRPCAFAQATLLIEAG